MNFGNTEIHFQVVIEMEKLKRFLEIWDIKNIEKCRLLAIKLFIIQENGDHLFITCD